MLPVGQIERIEVVKPTPRQLADIFAVDIDLVNMERFLVVRLERNQDLIGVERQVRPPERPGQRLLGKEHLLMAVRRKPGHRHQPPAGRPHIAEPVTGLVPIFAPLRIGDVDVENRVEVDRRILEEDRPLDAAHLKVELLVAAGDFFRLFRQGFDFAALLGQVGPRVLDPVGQFRGTAQFVEDRPLRRVPAALGEPVASQQLLGLFRRTVDHLGGIRLLVRRHRLRDIGSFRGPGAQGRHHLLPLGRIGVAGLDLFDDRLFQFREPRPFFLFPLGKVKPLILGERFKFRGPFQQGLDQRRIIGRLDGQNLLFTQRPVVNRQIIDQTVEKFPIPFGRSDKARGVPAVDQLSGDPDFVEEQSVEIDPHRRGSAVVGGSNGSDDIVPLVENPLFRQQPVTFGVGPPDIRPDR